MYKAIKKRSQERCKRKKQESGKRHIRYDNITKQVRVGRRKCLAVKRLSVTNKFKAPILEIFPKIKPMLLKIQERRFGAIA